MCVSVCVVCVAVCVSACVSACVSVWLYSVCVSVFAYNNIDAHIPVPTQWTTHTPQAMEHSVPPVTVPLCVSALVERQSLFQHSGIRSLEFT